MDYIGKKISPEEMRDAYPGFPAFVHHIMAGVANGQSPEEAAASVGDMINVGAISATIEEIESARLTFDETAGEQSTTVDIDES